MSLQWKLFSLERRSLFFLLKLHVKPSGKIEFFVLIKYNIQKLFMCQNTFASPISLVSKHLFFPHIFLEEKKTYFSLCANKIFVFFHIFYQAQEGRWDQTLWDLKSSNDILRGEVWTKNWYLFSTFQNLFLLVFTCFWVASNIRFERNLRKPSK